MPAAVSTSRLLIAVALAAMSAQAFAGPMPDPVETEQINSWDYYNGNCQKLQRDMADTQNGRFGNPREALYALQQTMGNMNYYRRTLAPQRLNSQAFAQCENVFAQAQAMESRAKTDVDADREKGRQQDRIAYENSPEYRRARSLGYIDVGGISFLKMLQDMYGETAMKKFMLTVDLECGQYFQATQAVKPYVIYTVSASSGGCGEEKRIAVLGGKAVERGDLIDQDAVFEYVGWKRFTAGDGFPVDVRVVTQKR